jgi:hypothetical protein
VKKTIGIVTQIREFVLSELRNGPMRRSTIIKKTLAGLPGSNANTITGTIHQLSVEQKIVRHAEKGVWTLPSGMPLVDRKPVSTLHEEDFYKSFANWLIEDVAECTNATALGGNVFRGKWGTPDVVGVFQVSDKARYRRNEIVSFVSAEVKLDTNQPVTAFGQACAYLRFSHKVYLVLPATMTDDDKQRVETLCGIVGLGLVYFDPSNAETPDFEIRVRPSSREPDADALNQILDDDNIFKKLR